MSAEEATASALRRSRDRLEGDGVAASTFPSEAAASGRGRRRPVTPPPPVPQLPSTKEYRSTATSGVDMPVQDDIVPVLDFARSRIPPPGMLLSSSLHPAKPLLPQASASMSSPIPPPPTAWSTSLNALVARTTTNAYESTFPSSIISNHTYSLQTNPHSSAVAAPQPPPHAQQQLLVRSAPESIRTRDVTVAAQTFRLDSTSASVATPPRLPSLELGGDVDLASWGL